MESVESISVALPDRLWRSCLCGDRVMVSKIYYLLIRQNHKHPYQSWARSYIEALVTDEGEKYLALREDL